ncbi:MAG: hypothetical protein BYD32DRAFT_409166 [Podila humilis]|nr:MAG: hypothetical protein BYD32DRAFT_409166 [Podila humilis]
MARLLHWVTCMLAFLLVASAATDCEHSCTVQYGFCCGDCPPRGYTTCYSNCAKERSRCEKAC